jgi:hypothetical protein
MALTCLQIIQTACRRIGILAPNAAVGSTDPQIIQLLALSEEEGQEQADRYQWETLQQEATFTTVAAQIQTTIAAITTGFNYIVNDTIWNRTLRRPVYGPKSQQDWQQDKALQLNGPFNSFRIINDVINFYPNPVAGESCYFEYISENWITTSGGSASAIWTNDADTPKLNSNLMVLGTIWRWKQAKGLDYAEDFAKYESNIMDAMGRDAGKPTLSMNGARWEIQPAILVPRGSW